MKDQLCEYFKNCAYAYSVEDFDRNIEKMRSIGGDIFESFLEDISKEYHSIIHFQGNWWGEMSNAIAKSFNAMISEKRRMPILDLIESIMGRLMVMMSNRRRVSVLCYIKKRRR